MDKASKRRWSIWGGILLATVIAIFAPDPQSTESVVEKAAAKVESSKVSTAPTAESEAEEEDDPFAPRSWEPPPPPPPPTLKTQNIVRNEPAPVQAPVGPPPLPYSYMGQMLDGGEQVVYLGRGEQLVVARLDETLEGVYKVIRMTNSEIEFLHLPSGEKQILTMNSARP